MTAEYYNLLQDISFMGQCSKTAGEIWISLLIVFLRSRLGGFISIQYMYIG